MSYWLSNCCTFQIQGVFHAVTTLLAFARSLVWVSLVFPLRLYALAWIPTCSTHCMVTFSPLDACSCCLHASLMVITLFAMFTLSRNTALFLVHLLSGRLVPVQWLGRPETRSRYFWPLPVFIKCKDKAVVCRSTTWWHVILLLSLVLHHCPSG